MSGLALSNRALWRVARSLMGVAPRLLVLGGGGYNPWAVARCWAGVWAVLNGIEPAAAPTAAAQAVLRGLWWNRSQGRDPPEHWFTTIADAPRDGRRAGRGAGACRGSGRSAQARAVTGVAGAVGRRARATASARSSRDSGLNSRAAAPACLAVCSLMRAL